MSEQFNHHPLKDFTALAVPLWIERCKSVPFDQLQAKVQNASDELGSKGDELLFKSKKKGESARLFNLYAESVAVLSFVPGGVTIFGHHFEAIHPDLAKSDKQREQSAKDFGGLSGFQNWIDATNEAVRVRTRVQK